MTDPTSSLNRQSRKVCPCCKGRGTIHEPIDWFPAVFTFGMTALINLSEQVECKPCDGRGYL